MSPVYRVKSIWEKYKKTVLFHSFGVKCEMNIEKKQLKNYNNNKQRTMITEGIMHVWPAGMRDGTQASSCSCCVIHRRLHFENCKGLGRLCPSPPIHIVRTSHANSQLATPLSPARSLYMHFTRLNNIAKVQHHYFYHYQNHYYYHYSFIIPFIHYDTILFFS